MNNLNKELFDYFVEQFQERDEFHEITENEISNSDLNFIRYKVQTFYKNQKFYDIKYLSENIITMMIYYMMFCDRNTIADKLKQSNQYMIHNVIRFIYKAELPSYNKIKNMCEDEIKNNIKTFNFYYELNQMTQLDAVFLYVALFGTQTHHYDNLKSIMPIDISQDVYNKLKNTEVFNMQYVVPALIDQEYAKQYIDFVHQIVSNFNLS